MANQIQLLNGEPFPGSNGIGGEIDLELVLKNEAAEIIPFPAGYFPVQAAVTMGGATSPIVTKIGIMTPFISVDGIPQGAANVLITSQGAFPAATAGFIMPGQVTPLGRQLQHNSAIIHIPA